MHYKRLLITAVSALACLPLGAMAHYSWLAPAALQMESGAALAVAFGWGHHPGENNHLDASRMASLSLWHPDGSWQGLPLHGVEQLSTPPLNTAGIYTLAAQQSRSYWSRTIEGGRAGSLQDYPDASHCSYGNNSSKALLQVGDSQAGSNAATRPLGQPLEIVPLAIPHRLAAGEELILQVLLFGAPASDTAVNLYRVDIAEQEPQTLTTDSQGQVHLSLASGVEWLAQTETRVPFHDQALCHEHGLNGTLRFRR